MTDVLAQTSSVLLIDYPGQEVPEAVARAGFTTIAHEGPGPDEYYTYELGSDGEIAHEHLAPAPEHVDLVYTYRPVEELAEIVKFAVELGARAVWFQDDGSSNDAVTRARVIVEEAGLAFASGPIIDAVRDR